jgi:hypothetical protein
VSKLRPRAALLAMPQTDGLNGGLHFHEEISGIRVLPNTRQMESWDYQLI